MQSGNLQPPASTFLGPFRRKVSVWTGAQFRVRRPPANLTHSAVTFQIFRVEHARTKYHNAVTSVHILAAQTELA